MNVIDSIQILLTDVRIRIIEGTVTIYPEGADHQTQNSKQGYLA